VLPTLVHRCRVPRDLTAETSARVEVDPREIGVDPEAPSRIWAAVERLYQTGIHPDPALCVRRQGRLLLDRAIDHAAGNGLADAPDTPKVKFRARALQRERTPDGTYAHGDATAGMSVG